MSGVPSVPSVIMGRTEQGGGGLRQDVACVAEQRPAGVTSRKEGVKLEPVEPHGLRYANWRLAGAERGSAELRGTLAHGHRSPPPPPPSPETPPLPPFASPGPLPHLSPLQLSAPHASHRQAW